jgi:histidinol phosphatase-like enzyme (inositol monophosphatase family)
MTDRDLKPMLDFALEAAWQAGRLTLGYYQSGLAVERKGDSSPVTRADREAEQKLRQMIESAFPDHGIIGEEYGRVEGKSTLTWIIDPIDGTKSFISGVPFYSNLIALTDGEHSLLGVINLPALGEVVYATRGGGCYWNGRPTHVSQTAALADAVLLSSDAYYRRDNGGDAWARLCEATYFQRTWGDAYGYTLIATGRADVMIDPYMEIWDAAPLQVIIEEAGGTFTDWKGVPTFHSGEAIATNGRLHEAVLALVQQG